MRRLTPLFLASILFSALSAAHADDASKRAKAEELMRITKLDQLTNQIMDQTMDQMKSGLYQNIMGVELTPQQQATLAMFQARISDVFKREFSWNLLEPEYAKLYADTYTERELDDILAFDKSPTGQAVIAKNPELLKQSSAIAQARLSAMMPELQQLTRDFIAQAAKASQEQKQQHQTSRVD